VPYAGAPHWWLARGGGPVNGRAGGDLLTAVADADPGAECCLVATVLRVSAA
jgi:hypothetical protein